MQIFDFYALYFPENLYLLVFICREYFDLVESLLKQNLILEKFDIDNMFVNIFDRVPTLRVLLTEGITYWKYTFFGRVIIFCRH